MPAITAGHLKGWKYEEELFPKLQELFDEPLVKTPDRFNLHDWTTESHLIDLKTRFAPITEDTYPEWNAPVCKFYDSDKEIVCFYYFEATKNLFYIIYDKDLFATFKKFYNRNGQLTYDIPRAAWTLV